MLTSVKTGKTIRIKTAQRLRGPAPAGDGASTPVKKKLTKQERDALRAQHQADQENARLRDERAKAGDYMTASERAMAESESDTGDGEVVVFRTGPGQAWRWRRDDHLCDKRYMAREQAERAAAKANPSAIIRVDAASANLGREATKASTTNPERDTGEPGATGAKLAKRLSLLDAAAQVLADAAEPMNAKELVEQVKQRGLWTPGTGKTPHATLYAAIHREIASKPDAARFTKVQRGRFAAKGA